MIWLEDKEELRSVDTQYYFGDDMVVAPVLRGGMEKHTLYIPEVRDWKLTRCREVSNFLAKLILGPIFLALGLQNFFAKFLVRKQNWLIKAGPIGQGIQNHLTHSGNLGLGLELQRASDGPRKGSSDSPPEIRSLIS